MLEFDSLSELNSFMSYKESDYKLLSLFPFSQAKELGYVVKDTGNKILSLDVNKQRKIPLIDLLNFFPKVRNIVSELDYEILDQTKMFGIVLLWVKSSQFNPNIRKYVLRQSTLPYDRFIIKIYLCSDNE